MVLQFALISILTPDVFAQDNSSSNTSGIALIAQGIGSFSCGDGPQLENVEIFVLLSESTIKGSGFSPSGLGLKSQNSNENIAIKLNSGILESNNFVVGGELFVDSLCELDSSTEFIAEGSCGANQRVTVAGTDGSYGTFQSEVTCN